MKYRKKPVVIDAVLFDGTLKGALAMFDEFNVPGAKYVPNLADPTRGGTITIPTLEGVMIASPGDYIIRGVRGEYYPCKPDIFAATYERADETPRNDTVPTKPGIYETTEFDRFHVDASDGWGLVVRGIMGTIRYQVRATCGCPTPWALSRGTWTREKP